MTAAETLLLAGGAAAAAASAVMLARPASLADATWHSLRFGRKLEHEAVEGLVRSLAADRGHSPIATELHATTGSVTYRLGAADPVIRTVIDRIRTFCPTITTEKVERPVPASGWAWSIRFDTRNRPLRSDQAETAARSVLAALGHLATDEAVTVQWILGRRLPPMAVPNAIDTLPTGSAFARTSQLLLGTQQPVDAERRRALRDKVSEPGFRAVCRIGVTADNYRRARSHAHAVLAGLRVLEGPGVRLKMRRANYSNAAQVREPWVWPLAISVPETAAALCWPTGDADYPGVDRSHIRPIRAQRVVPRRGRVVSDSTYPGDERPLAISALDSLMHMQVIGPTGVGKSSLMLNLILQDIDARRAVVVIDPKGDLVRDVLARTPEKRRGDVVVLDPADASRPVGLNPLKPSGRMPELVADQVLAVFHGLYKENWGPRTQDILHASLLTLIGRPDATLCALPVLLSNPAYRRQVVANIEDEIALRPFWAWYDSISDAERQQAIAPVMNKLRAFLLRPRMRAVLGQANPAFDMMSVFTERKILLVSLAKGVLGPEASALLGSLVVSQLWNATLGRSSIPYEKRHPVMCFIDEFQDYLHLPTDLGDALTQARGLGLGLTLAHQHLGQLTPDVRQAVKANARSKIAFQLEADDATVFARNVPNLEAEDFASLGAYEVYANLMAGGQVAGYASGRTRMPIEPVVSPQQVRALSRQRYGRNVAEVEAELAALLGNRATDSGGEVGRRPRRQP